MTQYYVIPQVVGASDSNAGTSLGSPWLTIGKAATTMTAGDRVDIAGGWVYKELPVAANSGSSGSLITYHFDVTGEFTGYGGIALISAYDNENDRSVGARAACFNLNGKEFITIRNATMEGPYGIYDASLAGNRGYEAVIIENCALIGYTNGIELNLGTGATPAGATGLTIRNCKATSVIIKHTNNASANINAKLLIENVTAHNYIIASNGNTIDIVGASTNTFSVGGVTVANCMTLGAAVGIRMTLMKNTTNISYVYNCMGYAGTTFLNFSGTASAVEYYSCVSLNGTTLASGGTAGDIYSTAASVGAIFGGVADFPLYRSLGWSPFLPGEPITFGTYKPGILGYGASDKYLPTQDMYGNPRGLGRPNYWAKFYFDGSDDPVSDPGTSWTTESNITDTDLTSGASTGTTGSVSSNYITAGGTNAPGSGGTIQTVYARFRADTSSGTSVAHVSISTDAWAEVLGTPTLNVTTTDAWAEWTALTTPSGGWTWAKIQALEFRGWRNSGTGTTRIYIVQIAVVTDAGHSDLGAVEERNRPAKSTTSVHGGTYNAEFSGAGFKEFWRPVAASSTTITAYARFDSNYAGSKPKMEVFNIPGTADQSDTMTSGANTDEQLSINFTPTSAGWVRVRLSSQDVSTTGKCYFDDVA